MKNVKTPSRRLFLQNLGMAGGALGAATAHAHTTSAPPTQNEYLENVLDPSFVDERIDSRSVSFENPTGARGLGCMSMLHGTRKSKAGRTLSPGEKVVLADIKGPGKLRHIWMALDWRHPESMRA